ncbi:hypothetical protein IN07_20690 [Modestobacter caceresii]|uniref:Uncharacterized protein n=1 Tax=Modestobacter caceresii TaxID=1522368 RepID=A0A098Y5E4_9ACTN|nr:hypothetical protein [Modestobacter caceresii]KGH44906.1 hypothetical protein IN07_20690 [Modestobacter caceresii]
MGDVRAPALATLLAALIAVGGSIFAVRRSGRQQVNLQTREFEDRRASREAHWQEERDRAARAAEIDSCIHFDAALALSLARLHRTVDFVGRPRLRRRVLGRRWAQDWQQNVQAAMEELALPISTVRLSARPIVWEAVDAAADAFADAAAAVGSLPKLPEPLLIGPIVTAWRQRVDTAVAEVQQSRRRIGESLGAPSFVTPLDHTRADGLR